MRRFLPVIIGAGLIALISILLWFWKPSDPTSSPVATKPVGTSTLNDGGPAPVRKNASTGEKPRADITGQTTAR